MPRLSTRRVFALVLVLGGFAFFVAAAWLLTTWIRVRAESGDHDIYYIRPGTASAFIVFGLGLPVYLVKWAGWSTARITFWLRVQFVVTIVLLLAWAIVHVMMSDVRLNEQFASILLAIIVVMLVTQAVTWLLIGAFGWRTD